MSIFDEAENIRKRLEELDNVIVRIALFGQPGAGKSSLINKLTGQKLAREGVKTDQTTEAAVYDWQGLHLVDLPGYGTQRFPAVSYFENFDIPSFDIFLCVFEGKFRDEDTEFFHRLRSIGKICLFVRNKADGIYEEGKTVAHLKKEIQEDLQNHVKSGEPVFFTSCRTRRGIDKLTSAIAGVLEEAKQERYYRDAKPYSDEFLSAKKKACEHYVVVAAGASAANALNPIPGADIAVDISILLTLFQKLRAAFGLTDKALETKDWVRSAAPLAKNVARYITREGILLLLKRFAGQVVTKEITKWIPFIGSAIAASVGFGITNAAGHAYLNDCYALAETILAEELGSRTENS